MSNNSILPKSADEALRAIESTKFRNLEDIEMSLFCGVALETATIGYTGEFAIIHEGDDYRFIDMREHEGMAELKLSTIKRAESKLPRNAKQALAMFLKAEFDEEKVAEVDGIQLLWDDEYITFIDETMDPDGSDSDCVYKISMKKE